MTGNLTDAELIAMAQHTTDTLTRALAERLQSHIDDRNHLLDHLQRLADTYPKKEQTI